MILSDVIKEWIKYEPFEYMVSIYDDNEISITARNIDQRENITPRLTGVICGRINDTHNWVRLRGKCFYAADPQFFNQLERELADLCCDPNKGWGW